MTTPDQKTGSASGGFGAFRSRDFSLYFVSRLLALIAAEMQITTVGWQVYRLTGEPLDLGFVGLAQFLPFALLFLVSGLAADRFPRIRILTLCIALQTGCAIAFFLLDRSGQASFAAMLGVLVPLGIARAFAMPAHQAIIPSLVPERDLPNAIAWNSSGNQACRIAGPTIAGIMIAICDAAGLGEGPVYAAVAAMFAAATMFTLLIRARPRIGPVAPVTLFNLLAGLRFIGTRQVILGAIGLDLFAVLFGGVTALLPVFARDILDVGAEGFGLLRSSLTVGALLGALLLTQRPIRRHAGRKLLLAVAIFGAGSIVFGLSTNFWLSMAALFIMGAADSVSVFVRLNLVQIITPDEMRGRVSAVNGVFIGASNELGEFESGVTAHWWGTVPAVIVGGAATCLVAILFAAIFRDLRRVDSLDADNLIRRYRDMRPAA